MANLARNSLTSDYIPFREKYSLSRSKSLLVIFNNLLTCVLGKRQQWHSDAEIKFPSKVAVIIERKTTCSSNLPVVSNPK